MAYVNVAEWKPDQVTEWLRGLDSSILPYLQLFLNNQVSGQQLLNVRSEDLDNLGVKRLGHQELILEAVEHLRNFHYELDRENLQLLALRLSCQAHSLHNELCQHTDSQPVSTQTLADVASVVRAVKPLVCWLDRSPFTGQLEYTDRKTDLLKYSLEIATCAQRDRFAERPVEEIRSSCGKLATIADGIIQDIADPLILQPASLDLATLRKRGGDDLGFFILPSFHGVHQIGEIKFGSPAHQCGKVEEGDEVVQVNYQTIVGWQRKKVMALFEESLTDVFLTLKKRPRHTKVYGQIYMKPYRLPSKKRAPAYTRWHDSLPSPRPELLTIPNFEIPIPRTLPLTPPSKHITLEPLNSTIISISSESDDVGSGCDEASIDYELEGHASPTSMRLYLPKPRVPVQRRATITGASPTSHLPPVDIEKFWRELKLEKKWKFSGKTPASHNSNPECRLLRNKSPCEQNERPSTCLGFEKSSSKEFIKRVDYVVKADENLKEEFVSHIHNENLTDLDKVTIEQREDCNPSINSKGNHESPSNPQPQEQKCGKRFITRIDLIVDPHDSRIEFAEISQNNAKVSSPTDGEAPASPFSEAKSPKFVEKSRKISTESQVGELPIHRERGRLDKSFSTPAYDLSGLEGLGINSTDQKSPSVKNESKTVEKATIGKISPFTANETTCNRSAMPDVTTSTSSPNKKAQDYSDNTVFKFPSPSTSPCLSHIPVQKFGRHHVEKEHDLNCNPVLHGRVVETINRHLLDSNCGKDGDDDCDDLCDINRLNPGLSKTVTNIVLNSPDLISDISSHRIYPQPDDDVDNGNNFCSQSSPKLDNSGSHFDFNLNSAHIKLPSIQHNLSPALPEQCNKENEHVFVQSSELPSSKMLRGDSKKPPPTPPARLNSSLENSDHSPIQSHQPKVPLKISVNPPEPPPRPNPPNRSPLIPSEQHKSSLRAMISCKTGSQKSAFGSPKVTRKKNPLLAKRRSVSVKELGIADYQGWLYRRLRIGDCGAQWIKGWFILKGTTFYGFKGREAHKADCFISLPGFTISAAEEVKSKKYAFKVYHTGTVFYFASESDEELAAWMDCLSMATYALDVSTLKKSVSEGAVFSETEDEGDDAEVADSCFPSPKMRKFTNFLSGHSSHSTNVSGTTASPKPARSHQNLASSGESKTYDIQKKFGSLKKLGYRSKYSNQLSSQSSSSASSLAGSEPSQDVPSVSAPHSLDRKYLRFLSSSKNQNVPVPTAQFRSYRRVVATEHCPTLSGNSKPIDGGSILKPDGSLIDASIASAERSSNNVRSMNSSYGDHDLRRINRGLGQRGDDLSGLLTLEQFMLQRQEEERLQNQLSHASQQQERFREHDVERDAAPPNQREASEAYTGYTEDPVLSLHKSLEKRRTPPPAPSPSALPSQQQSMSRPIPAARTVLSATGVTVDNSCEPPAIVPRMLKPSTDFHDNRDLSSTSKQNPDSLSEAHRRTLLAPKQPRLKNAAMYQPPPVAFSPPPNFGPSFEMHLDNQSAAAHDEIWDGSRSRGAGSKIRQFLSPKRGHYQTSHAQSTPISQPDVPNPISHRTILGSPRFHRVLFRQGDIRKPKSVQQADASEKPVGSPTAFGSLVPSASSSPILSPDWSSDFAPSLSPKPTMGVAMLGKKPMVSLSNISSLSAMSPPLSPPQTPLSPPPDYPGLEYPPVFEPAIYSLSDSSTFLSQSPSLYSPSSDTSSSQQSQR